MASPAYRSSFHTESTSGTSLAVTKPASTADNDILALWVYWENNSAVTVYPPSGFSAYTACSSDNTGPNPDFHVRTYWKRAASEGGSYTVGLSASSAMTMTIAAFSGAVTTGTPIEAGTVVSGNSTSCTLPSIQTLTNETYLVGFAHSYDWTKTWSSTAITERADSGGAALYGTAMTTAGTTGTKLITQSGTDQFIGIFFDLASTAAGGSIGTITVADGVCTVVADAVVARHITPATAGDGVVLTAADPVSLITIIGIADGVVNVVADPVSLEYLGGPSVTPVTVGDGVVQVFADAVTLNAITPLTVGDGVVITAADAVVTRAISPVTVGDGVVVTAADGVTLRGITPITVGDGVSQVFADAAVTRAISPVTVGDGVVLTAADAVTLNGITPLTVGDGIVQVFADPAVLSSAGVTVITVGDGVVQTFADGATARAITPLAVGDGVVQTYADPATARALTPLTVGDGVAQVYADPVTLTSSGLSTVYVTAGDGVVGVYADPATIILAALILHGARRVYRPTSRQTHEPSLRGTYRVPARGQEEVDD